MSQRPRGRRLEAAVDESDHVQGLPAAPVTLVVYGDYACLDCRRAHRIIKGIQKRMRGQMRFVFRHFPQTGRYEHSQQAAEAAEAAGAQGMFWQMHDSLFEGQGRLDQLHLARYAAELKIDLRRFLRETSRHIHADRIHKDVAGGRSSGVTATPAFFINGVRHESSFGLATLLPAIQAAGGREP